MTPGQGYQLMLLTIKRLTKDMIIKYNLTVQTDTNGLLPTTALYGFTRKCRYRGNFGIELVYKLFQDPNLEEYIPNRNTQKERFRLLFIYIFIMTDNGVDITSKAFCFFIIFT